MQQPEPEMEAEPPISGQEEGLLEDLLAPRREIWNTFLPSHGDIISNRTSSSSGLIFPGAGNWSFDEDLLVSGTYSSSSSASYPSFLELITCNHLQLQPPPPPPSSLLFQSFHGVDEIYPSSYDETSPVLLIPIQEHRRDYQDQEYPPSSMVVEADHKGTLHDQNHKFELNDDHEAGQPQLITTTGSDHHGHRRHHHHSIHEIPSAAVFDMGFINNGSEMIRKAKSKKIEGQPSKNLMAERRRRKRLNDRLSMLRSIVPKISKMDRTSILGDTIDYMKELLEKIHSLKEQDHTEDRSDVIDKLNLVGSFKELNMADVQVRNPPKFEVERRNNDTRIQICCSAKPGLLLSTVNTLEALGLDIQQCVISCFNDFSLQASCSEEEVEHQRVINSEDMKQVLFRNAGYGGRCL